MPRPAVREGDTWTYQRTDLWNNKILGRGTSRVVFANDKVIQTVVKRGNNPAELDESYTADWNAIATIDGSNFSPHSGTFKFPLEVGMAYPQAFENTIPRLGAFRVKHERTVRVVGWEEVAVPAGRFRALRIESDGSFMRLDQSVSGYAKSVTWYAPEVKRMVKQTYEDGTFRGRFNWWSIELVEYKVQ